MAEKWNRHRFIRFGATAFIALATFAAIVAIIRDTAHNGWDLNVYRAAALAILDGRSPYALGETGGWPFKYPPWTLPFFIPFGLGSESFVKWTWGAAQAGAVLYSVSHLIRCGFARGPVVFTAFAYWWIWAYHALAGQISLALLVIGLALGPHRALTRNPRKESLRLAFLAISFSMRIFSVFPLLMEWRRLIRPGAVAVTAGIAILASIPAWIVTADGSPITLLNDWLSSASITNEVMTTDLVRERRNQSLTCAVLRALGVSGSNTTADAIVFFLMAAVTAVIWHRASRGLTLAERWYGWMGLSVVVHPLSWFHSFVLAFPVSAAALSRAWSVRDRRLIGGSVLGIALTSWVSQSVLGEFGHALELASVRSWGVVLSCIVLARTSFKGRDGYPREYREKRVDGPTRVFNTRSTPA